MCGHQKHFSFEIDHSSFSCCFQSSNNTFFNCDEEKKCLMMQSELNLFEREDIKVFCSYQRFVPFVHHEILLQKW